MKDDITNRTYQIILALVAVLTAWADVCVLRGAGPLLALPVRPDPWVLVDYTWNYNKNIKKVFSAFFQKMQV